MIEPSPRDISRQVETHRDGVRMTGRITSFNAVHVFVRMGFGSTLALRREELFWTVRQVARAAAARSLIEAAGLAIEEIDEVHWRVAGFLFWPATGLWRWPGGRPGGGGAVPMLRAIKATQIAARRAGGSRLDTG